MRARPEVLLCQCKIKAELVEMKYNVKNWPKAINRSKSQRIRYWEKLYSNLGILYCNRRGGTRACDLPTENTKNSCILCFCKKINGGLKGKHDVHRRWQSFFNKVAPKYKISVILNPRLPDKVYKQCPNLKNSLNIK